MFLNLLMYLILRNQSKCNRSVPCTKRYCIEVACSIDPKLWDKVLTEIKNSKSLEEFKPRIESSVPQNCPCKICKRFNYHVGYLLTMNTYLCFSLFVFSNNIEAFFIFFFLAIMNMKVSSLIS